MKKLSLIFKAFIVLCAAAGILLQCGLGSGALSGTSLRMFTTLSNLAVAIYYVFHIAFALRGGLPCSMHRFKFAVTLCIMLTGLVAHFMLRQYFADVTGLYKTALTLLHYVVPISVVADWLVFDEKGNAQNYMPLFAAAFPVVYAAVSLAMAVADPDRWPVPYPFLDFSLLGWGGVMISMLGLAAAFLGVGYLGVWVDGKLAKGKK